MVALCQFFARSTFHLLYLSFDCRFAIKTQLCPKESEFQNVLREVRFLRACRHPCIIDVHDAFLMTNPR